MCVCARSCCLPLRSGVELGVRVTPVRRPPAGGGGSLTFELLVWYELQLATSIISVVWSGRRIWAYVYW